MLSIFFFWGWNPHLDRFVIHRFLGRHLNSISKPEELLFLRGIIFSLQILILEIQKRIFFWVVKPGMRITSFFQNKSGLPELERNTRGEEIRVTQKISSPKIMNSYIILCRNIVSRVFYLMLSVSLFWSSIRYSSHSLLVGLVVRDGWWLAGRG